MPDFSLYGWWYVSDAWFRYYREPNKFVTNLADATFYTKVEAHKVLALFSTPENPLHAQDLSYHGSLQIFAPTCPTCNHQLRRHNPGEGCESCYECLSNPLYIVIGTSGT